MDNEPKRGGPTALILAHAVCCGGIVLVATGALSGMGAWLLEGGLTWLLAAAVLTAASLYPVAAPDRRGHWQRCGASPACD